MKFWFQDPEVKKLLQRGVLFCMPFSIIGMLNYVVDPYNINHAIPLAIDKEPIASRYNERLWKLNQFKQNPTTYLIIGDSRAQRIHETTVQSVTDLPYKNLALSGATLPEVIDTFWFAADVTNLKTVYLCLNFDRFTDWQTASNVSKTIELIKNPLAHYFRPETTKATFMTIAHLMNITIAAHQQPPVDQATFWQAKIHEADRLFGRFVQPKYLTEQLIKVSSYAREHTIDLHFIVLPTHTDLQERIAVAHLQDQRQAFTTFLASLATVHDLDTVNEFTTNAAYFSDPWHCTHQAGDLIVAMVWPTERTI